MRERNEGLLRFEKIGWGSGDVGPRGGALGHSSTVVEEEMGNTERRPVATTLWRKKLRAGEGQAPAQGPAAR